MAVLFTLDSRPAHLRSRIYGPRHLVALSSHRGSGRFRIRIPRAILKGVRP